MIPITKGKIETAKKVVIYGAEGIGKSTLAAKFPDPVFIDTEGSTKELDVARYPTPKDWSDIRDYICDFIDELPGKTLVIDTADWAEQFCSRAVCKNLRVKGIEDIGYGKGYTYMKEEFAKMLADCTKLVECGINVVFTAHAQMRKFEQPDEMGAYDRWEMKLSKQCSPLLKEWADMVLFCNYKTSVITDNNTKSKKATGGKRVMYATHHPCWDAKNRYGLPDTMEMDYANIEHLFKTVKPVKDLDWDGPIPQKDPLLAACEKNGLTLDDIKAFTKEKGKSPEIKAIEDPKDYPEDYKNALIENIKTIKNIIKENKNNG